MIQKESMIKAADNSGARLLKVIQVYGGSSRRFGRIGDVLNCTVKKAAPHAEIKKGQMVRVVLVRSRKEFGREDGTYVRFTENAGVVIDVNKNPMGTRIFGPIAKEIRDKGYTKIVSLAKNVV